MLYYRLLNCRASGLLEQIIEPKTVRVNLCQRAENWRCVSRKDIAVEHAVVDRFLDMMRLNRIDFF